MTIPPESPTLSRPYSRHFAEHYWSGGAAEKTHVFLTANKLAERMAGATTFTVSELGFGTALNALLTMHLWQNTAPEKARLTYISYEKFPIPQPELTAIHAAFPQHLQPLSATFLAAYKPGAGWNTLHLPQATLHLYAGDASTGIATHPQPADVWFLDGFSPANNPELWQPELLQQVYAHILSGGTATTYSVARLVRDSLTAAGFTLERQRGFPPKEHMLLARK